MRWVVRMTRTSPGNRVDAPCHLLLFDALSYYSLIQGQPGEWLMVELDQLPF